MGEIGPAAGQGAAAPAVGTPAPAGGARAPLRTVRSTLVGRLHRRYDDELARLSPGRRAVLAWVLRHPEAVVVPASLVVLAALGAANGEGDGARFRLAGSQMVGPGFLHVFADPWLQIGPLYLFPLGVVDRLVQPWAGAATGTVLAAVQGALVVWLAMGTTRRAARLNGMPDLLARWVVGVALAVGGTVSLALEWGHPEEVALALLVVESGMLAARGHAGRGGALLGVALGVKSWAGIGVGVLLASRRLRSTLVAVAMTVLVVAVVYLPFAVLGEMNTFQHVWHFSGATPLGWLAARTGASQWLLRVVQGGVAAAVGAAAARARWSSPTLLALVVVTARLVLEPEPLPYYVCPAVATALVWVWTSRAPSARRWRVVVTLLSPLPIQLRDALAPDTLVHTWLAMVVALTAFALVAEARTARGAAPTEVAPADEGTVPVPTAAL